MSSPQVTDSIWVQRVGRLSASLEGGNFAWGTGIEIAPALILTASHVLADAGGINQAARFRFQPFSSRSQNTDQQFVSAAIPIVKCVWHNDVLDGCLLQLERPIQPVSMQLGCYFRRYSVQADSLGFPRSTWDSETNDLRSLQCKGSVLPWSGRGGKGDVLLFDVHTSGHVASDWAGFSGAPIVVGETLLGIVTQVRTTPAARLQVSILSDMLDAGLSSFVKQQPESVDPYPALEGLAANPSSIVKDHLDRVVAAVKQAGIDRTVNQAAHFDLRAQLFGATAEIHERLFDWQHEEYPSGCMTPHEILQLSKPLLFQSPGGSGKTSFLIQTVHAAISEGMVPVYLDFGRRQSHSPIDDNSFDRTFDAFSQAFGIQQFRAFRDQNQCRILLVVDGFNERHADRNALVEGLLRESNAANVKLMIMDRLGSKAPTSGLQIASMVPLPQRQIHQVLGGASVDQKTARLLQSPLLLNLFLQLAPEAGDTGQIATRIRLLDQFFTSGVRIPEGQLPALYDTAFQFYEEARSTDIAGPILASIIHRSNLSIGEPDGNTADALVERGVLSKRTVEEAGGRPVEYYRFRHETLHDYLAARHLAAETGPQPQYAWRAQAFDIATIWGSSHEVLELTLEALALGRDDAIATADRFLRELYDWSYRAVIQLVRSQDRGPATRPILMSEELRQAVYLLCAEKLFDRFLHTSENARQILGIGSDSIVFGEVTAKRLLELQDVDELLELASTLEATSSYWKNWLAIFQSKSLVQRSDLNVLLQDPLLAWTAANSYRRRGCDEQSNQVVREWYEVSRRTTEDDSKAKGFRWRLVHLLGKSRDAGPFLLQVFRDRDEGMWVRYGAARSYIEVVSETESHTNRRASLELLAGELNGALAPKGSSRTKELRMMKELREEIRRCRNIAVEVPSWTSDYDQVVLDELSRLEQQWGIGTESLGPTLRRSPA